MCRIIALTINISLLLFGVEWQPMHVPPSAIVHDMSIGKDAATQQVIIYASGYKCGQPQGDKYSRLFKSEDEGVNWDSVVPREEVKDPEGVVTEPNNAKVVYICRWVVPSEPAVLKSINKGETWVLQGMGQIENTHCTCIAMDKNRPDTLYVGCDAWGCGIYRTEDGGETWVAKPILLPGAPTDPWILDISVISDILNSIVLAVSSFGGIYSGIWRSTDCGTTWEPRGLDRKMASVAFADMNVAYAGSDNSLHGILEMGVYKSIDGGYTWDHLPSAPQTYIYDIEVVSTDIVYIATAAGIYVTFSGGTFWAPINNGLRCTQRRHILTHPDSPTTTLFAGTAWCVYKSINGGNDWFEVTNGYPAADLRKITTNSSYIYCLGDEIPPGCNSLSIFRSDDYGNSWQTLSGLLLEGLNPSVIEVSPASYNTILLGGNELVPEQNEKGVIFRSLDYGENWIDVYKPVGPGVDLEKVAGLDIRHLLPQ